MLPIFLYHPGMVVFAISVFGTTLPHIFYGESLLSHMKTMQGGGPMSVPHNSLNHSPGFHFSDPSANLCRSEEIGNMLSLNRTLKSEWDRIK